MIDHNDPLSAVECPKCGSPVEGAKEGDLISCKYCGTTMKVGISNAGNLIGRMTSIDDSTTFIARTGALKRVQERLQSMDVYIDETIVSLKQLEEWDINLLDKQREVNSLKKGLEREIEEEKNLQGRLRFLLILAIVIIVFAFITENEVARVITIIISILIIVYVIFKRGTTKQTAKDKLIPKQQELAELENQRDKKERQHKELRDKVRELEEEQGRLKRREIELTASLDDLAGRL